MTTNICYWCKKLLATDAEHDEELALWQKLVAGNATDEERIRDEELMDKRCWSVNDNEMCNAVPEDVQDNPIRECAKARQEADELRAENMVLKEAMRTEKERLTTQVARLYKALSAIEKLAAENPTENKTADMFHIAWRALDAED